MDTKFLDSIKSEDFSFVNQTVRSTLAPNIHNTLSTDDGTIRRVTADSRGSTTSETQNQSHLATERLLFETLQLLQSVITNLALVVLRLFRAAVPGVSLEQIGPSSTLFNNSPANLQGPVTSEEKAVKELPINSKGIASPFGRGFLWKPVSDSDGKLAILLPSAISEEVVDVKLLSPDHSKVLATGRFTGIGNGDRAHFRFAKPGDGYPAGLIVQATLKDGTTFEHRISRPNSRNEKK